MQAKFLAVLLDHDETGGYAWGVATLANLYRELGKASRGQAASIAGCTLLLKSWIWAYFHAFRGHASSDLEALRDSRAAARDGAKAPQGADRHRLINLRRVLDQFAGCPGGSWTLTPRVSLHRGFGDWWEQMSHPYQYSRSPRQDPSAPAPIDDDVSLPPLLPSDLITVVSAELRVYALETAGIPDDIREELMDFALRMVGARPLRPPPIPHGTPPPQPVFQDSVYEEGSGSTAHEQSRDSGPRAD
ncbi:hypothetical protein QQ045_011781 [Rhodiola kirilowii]